MPTPTVLTDLVAEVSGRRHRDDQTSARAGGAAGNARLTAWTGAVLLALVLAQLVTLLDVDGLISWHVVIGALLIPVAVLKTTVTLWRAAGYYSGRRPYRVAGPPPLLLRVLGPLVVATTFLLLGTGVALIVLGPRSGRRTFLTVAGFGLDTLTLHQIAFIAFAVAAGLHLLARAVPATRQIVGRAGPAGVAGRGLRAGVLATALVASALTAVLILHGAGSWRHDAHGGHHHRPSPPSAAGILSS